MKKLFILFFISLCLVMVGCGNDYEKHDNPNFIEEKDYTGLTIGTTAEYEKFSATLLDVSAVPEEADHFRAQFEFIAYAEAKIDPAEFSAKNDAGQESTEVIFHEDTQNIDYDNLLISKGETATVNVIFTIDSVSEISFSYYNTEATWEFPTVTQTD